MQASTLIRLLQELPPDTYVYVLSVEGEGYDTITSYKALEQDDIFEQKERAPHTKGYIELG